MNGATTRDAAQHWDVLVVGAGPAGMAAATTAAAHGARVALLDDNRAPGGQIWRQGVGGAPDATAASHLRAVAASRVTLLMGSRVVVAPAAGLVEIWRENEESLERHGYGKLILATGARERFLPFPGWTLPGVFGAGGLQALVRGGYSVRGKRAVVAGTGPLLLAVAAHLREDGAHVVAVCEQAGLRQMLPFSLRLWNRPAKIRQAVGLLRQLRGVPLRRQCWPVAAKGTGKLESVEMTNGRRRWTVQCELLACGFHLVPNTELPLLLGCLLREGAVAVDALQRTSVPHVFCVGETTGIAGVDAALVQGEIAGHAAAGAEAQALKQVKKAARERAFGYAMDKAFRLRTELRSLCDAETIVCRCEDVRYGDLDAIATSGGTWTDAKLQTRCGMGPCQGRVCGPAVETLFGWKNTSIRPPLFPVPLSALATAEPDSFATQNDLNEERQ